MIVDDSASLRQVVSIALRGAGYEAIEARDGQDALAKLNGQKVHLIVSDVNMPNMDGLQALERINAANPDILVVMLTSLATRHVVERCLELGAVNFVRKDTPKEAMAKVLSDTIADHFGEE